MLLLCGSRVRSRKPAKWMEWLFWPIALIRVIIFAPTTYYMNHAANHGHVINRHAQLHNGTYGTAIVTGERFAYRWASVVWVYSVSSCVPSLVFIPPLYLPFTVVDTTLTVYVSMATYRQTAYAPRNKKDCYNIKTFGMRRPSGINESFFEAAARLDATVSTPIDMCLSFVKEWQFGVALCFFYALISLLGIILFFGSIIDAKQQNTSVLLMLKELGQDICSFLLFIPRSWVAALLTLYAIPLIFFRCLPLSVKAPVRSARRHTIKTGLGAEQNTEIALTEFKSVLKKSKKSLERYHGGEGSHTELAQFLGVYDILILIAKDLHYIDVMNLARVSKSVRKSVLPSNDLPRRLPIYKLYTCDADDKRPCWICTTPICSECCKIPAIPQEYFLYHLENCIPYCRSCYYEHVVNVPHARNARFMSTCCKCGPCRAPPKTALGRFILLFMPYPSKPRVPELIGRPLCRSCGEMTPDKILSLKEKTTKLLLINGLRANGKKWRRCARIGCGNTLGTGPRFWVCPDAQGCGKECISTSHQAWESKDDVAPVGDESV